jgi:hypothetical protein
LSQTRRRCKPTLDCAPFENALVLAELKRRNEPPIELSSTDLATVRTILRAIVPDLEVRIEQSHAVLQTSALPSRTP